MLFPIPGLLMAQKLKFPVLCLFGTTQVHTIEEPDLNSNIKQIIIIKIYTLEYNGNCNNLYFHYVHPVTLQDDKRFQNYILIPINMLSLIILLRLSG